MIKFTIPFKKNIKVDELEQAAGFPPYTRGYNTVSKNVKLCNKKSALDFLLTDFSDESILTLFTQIINKKVKGKISLEVPFSGNPKDIIYTKILRTLLAFVSDKLYNNAAIVKFDFFGDCTASNTLLNTLFFANTAQLDNLMVSNIDNWKIIAQILQKIPTDSLYGSEYLEKEIYTIFIRLWKLINKIST